MDANLIQVRQVSDREASLLEGLCDLLVDAVHGGASEAFAGSIGRTLLVLDTEVGSVAESVYRRRGWQRAGEIPDFALTPDGRLHATVYYYKLKQP